VRKRHNRMRGNRGVALIIVLLVTALLIALIFEFAFGTRVSLRAATNFRNSQRAYFIARSGLGVFARYNELRDILPQGEWGVVPYVSEGDTELRIRWEDESGKINIANVTRGNESYNRLTKLFDILRINQDVLDQISSWMIEERRSFYLLTELHEFLGDEDYRKVGDLLTVSANGKININTASSEVLQSLGLSAPDAESIVESRKQDPFDASKKTINSAPGMTAAIAGQLGVTSTVYKVSSFATVGGYTKQIEAIITLGGSGFTVNYWRAL
jgi:type II secretory pathway component PulK